MPSIKYKYKINDVVWISVFRKRIGLAYEGPARIFGYQALSIVKRFPNSIGLYDAKLPCNPYEKSSLEHYQNTLNISEKDILYKVS